MLAVELTPSLPPSFLPFPLVIVGCCSNLDAISLTRLDIPVPSNRLMWVCWWLEDYGGRGEEARGGARASSEVIGPRRSPLWKVRKVISQSKVYR